MSSSLVERSEISGWLLTGSSLTLCRARAHSVR